MASTVLAAMAETMLLTSMRTSWKSPFLSPAAGAMTSVKILPTEEPVWFATLRPLSSLTWVRLRSLRVTTCAVLADLFDLGDDDDAALVVADDEGLRGIGAQVHLPRHHLLHGEIAGGHGEFLELEAALLEQTRFEQVIGRHAPDIGLKALPDRLQRPSRPRRQPQRQHASREPLPPGQFNAPIAHRSPP